MIELDRNLVFVLLLIFILAGFQTETPNTTTTISIVKPEYVLSETELPIYELITPVVNDTYAESLAYSLFAIRDTPAEEGDDAFFINRGSESFEIDKRDGSMWFADYSKIWNISLGIGTLTPVAAERYAYDWLTDNGILPEGASLANIGSTNVTTYNIDLDRTLSKILQYNVNYEFTIGDIPVSGDAAQICVMIGEGGDRVGFDWKWRAPRPEPYTKLEMIEYESILETHGISPSNVISHRLAYTIDDNPEEAKFLFPVWEIEFIEPADDTELPIHHFVQIDATLFDPKVEIITPSGAYVAIPGETITFDCQVQFGTPPYTYEWSSDHDGILSTAKSFSTSFLSEVIKMDTHVPHAIAIRVRDAENRACSDVVKVTIEPGDFNPDITLTFIAAGAVGVLLLSLIVFRRRKIVPILFFLVMMFSAFLFLPITTASTEVSNAPVFIPSAPTGAYDDGVKEIGIEWVGLSHNHPLWWTETNIEGWYNKMGTTGGFSREFNWGEYSAWEEDFKDAQFSGTDTQWIDAVDFVYYQDHGGPDSVSFTSNHDDHGLNYWHMRLGDGDLDSIVFDACSPLAWQNSTGHDVFQRWAPAMRGIHQVCSFGTSSKNSATRGTNFATYMTDLGMTIVSAWFRACEETEPSDHTSAVFYATKSSNPYTPQLDDPINDHAYGFGYVCSDPKPGEFLYYVYIVSSC
ncbi:MAG: hypothetical protein JW779_15890 [Candidatus Thorarchaeota archaeon]|nr:hypothetical protein [Candidatus Thorarchaeota archaeon]